MKNRGLIITLIILLAITVFLLTMFLVACLTGRTSFGGKLFSFETKSSKIIFDKNFELAEIKNIEIKQDAGDVIFKETANDYIQVVLYGEDEKNAEVSLNNNNLHIDNTHKNGLSFINFGVTKNDIIVYIPASYQNNIKVNNDYGNCEITDLENASVDIDCDAGNVMLGKIKNAKIKCDYGNIEIKEILNRCDLKADCGNIEVDKISIKENSTIKADLGNVNINDTNNVYIDADVDLGKTQINQNNRNAQITLKINCDCGNVTVNN